MTMNIPALALLLSALSRLAAADPTRIPTERGAARVIAVPAATGCH